MTKNINADELDNWTIKELRTPDKIWNLIYDAISDPVFILSNKGEILYSNKASAEFLGISIEEFKGKHCYETVHKTPDFISGCPFVKSMHSKKRESYQLTIDDRWYMVTIDPLINENTEVIGAIHFIRDINDIVSLNAARTNLAGIIENSRNAIGSISLKGTIIFWNSGAEKLLGYSEEEISGKYAGILFSDENKPQYEEVMKKAAAGEIAGSFESVFVSKTGEKIEVSVIVSMMYDERNEIKGISFIASDLSARRKAEHELLYFVTESALRLKKPVEIIRNNLEDIKKLLTSGEITETDAKMLLDVQISNADKIIDNLRELNSAIAEKQRSIPEAYARFLNK